MPTQSTRLFRTRSVPALVLALGVVSVAVARPAPARYVLNPSRNEQAQIVRIVETSLWQTPSPDPMGIAYLAEANRLVVVDSEVEELPALFAGKNVFLARLNGELRETFASLHFSVEPTDIAFHPDGRRWFISDDDRDRIFEIDIGDDEIFGSGDDTLTQLNTRHFNSTDAEGIAYDSKRGHLLVADGVNAEIYDIAPGPNGRFDGVLPAGDDVLTTFDTFHLGIHDPEGIAYDPGSTNLYLIGHDIDAVIEVTLDGQFVRRLDFPIRVTPAGVTLAPSSANAQARSLYIVDRGKDNDQAPDENDGRIIEVVLTESPISSIPPFGIAFVPVITR